MAGALLRPQRDFNMTHDTRTLIVARSTADAGAPGAPAACCSLIPAKLKKPTKPKAPRRVTDEDENRRRAAQHEKDLSAYAEELAAHKDDMSKRKRQQDAANRPSDDSWRAAERRRAKRRSGRSSFGPSSRRAMQIPVL